MRYRLKKAAIWGMPRLPRLGSLWLRSREMSRTGRTSGSIRRLRTKFSSRRYHRCPVFCGTIKYVVKYQITEKITDWAMSNRPRMVRTRFLHKRSRSSTHRSV